MRDYDPDRRFSISWHQLARDRSFAIGLPRDRLVIVHKYRGDPTAAEGLIVPHNGVRFFVRFNTALWVGEHMFRQLLDWGHRMTTLRERAPGVAALSMLEE